MTKQAKKLHKFKKLSAAIEAPRGLFHKAKPKPAPAPVEIREYLWRQIHK